MLIGTNHHRFFGSPLNVCNKDCVCSDSRYEPVCGTDGLTYVTPCFAGCTGERHNQTGDPMTNITVGSYSYEMIITN